jgi:hypothetical protein
VKKMALKNFTKMEYGSADEMVFGEAKYPLSYGLGLKVGAGFVSPEINFAPRPGAEKTPESLTKEYVDYITTDIMNRAVTLGFPSLQLENEWIHQMGNNPQKFAKPVVAGQKAVMRKFHEEYGIACAIRHTVADPRLAEFGYEARHGQGPQLPREIIDSFEVAAENGADVLSIESMGGKEVADYAIVRQDIRGWLFRYRLPRLHRHGLAVAPDRGLAKKNKSSPVVTPTAPVRTPRCSWPAVTSTRISPGPSPRSPVLSLRPGPWSRSRPALPVRTRTAVTRDRSSRPSLAARPPRRVRVPRTPTLT